MSILNVNQIQPVGSGQTVTINAANISAGSATITAGTFSGNLNSTSGATTVAAGSTSAPSISPTGDSNTGIFFPSADTIAFAEGGVEAARFDSSGRLGIGTNNPGAPLHVVSNSSAEGIRLAGRSTDNIGSFYFRNNADSATYGLIQGRSTELRISSESASQPITFYTDSEKARIDTSGRLLVGTNTALTNFKYGGSGDFGSLVQYAGESSGRDISLSITNYHTSDTQPVLRLTKARGTKTSPSVVSANDYAGSIQFMGYDGARFIDCARIDAFFESTPGTNAMPGSLSFLTTTSGASTVTERMRISSLGTINTLAADDTLRLSMTYGAGNSYYFIMGYHTSSTVGGGGGTLSFRVTSNGNVQNTNGSYTAISDFKLKENIVDAASQWDDLKAIRIRNWNFKEETGHETHRQIGPIAQELEQVCPGLVFESPDRDENGNETGEVTKGVNQSVLYMKAVKALQEAQERIETLEAQNTSQASAIEALQARLDALENS